MVPGDADTEDILELTEIIRKGDLADAGGADADDDISFEQELEELFADDKGGGSAGHDSDGDDLDLGDLEKELDSLGSDIPDDTPQAAPGKGGGDDLTDLDDLDGLGDLEAALAGLDDDETTPDDGLDDDDGDGDGDLDLSSLDDLLNELDGGGPAPAKAAPRAEAAPQAPARQDAPQAAQDEEPDDDLGALDGLDGLDGLDDLDQAIAGLDDLDLDEAPAQASEPEPQPKPEPAPEPQAAPAPGPRKAPEPAPQPEPQPAPAAPAPGGRLVEGPPAVLPQEALEGLLERTDRLEVLVGQELGARIDARIEELETRLAVTPQPPAGLPEGLKAELAAELRGELAAGLAAELRAGLAEEIRTALRAELEEEIERQAAAAAARVIREEIAALLQDAGD